MKQAICWAAVAAALAAGAALAHGDKHAPAAKVEVKQTEFGRTGDPKRVTRTVEVQMSDTMRFSPAEITVKRGETVRFRVRNAGKLLHEMVLGTEKELKEHAVLMQKFPNMEHDEPYMVHVDPGKNGEMVWQFNRSGTYLYGCLIPGHFEAGMVGKIIVK